MVNKIIVSVRQLLWPGRWSVPSSKILRLVGGTSAWSRTVTARGVSVGAATWGAGVIGIGVSNGTTVCTARADVEKVPVKGVGVGSMMEIKGALLVKRCELDAAVRWSEGKKYA
jgi:hypothetical protein